MEQEKNKGAADYTVVPVTISSIPAIELSMVEKVLLCKIVSLSKGRPCNMSNMAFASCFGISTRQVTEHIKALTEKGWIDARRPSVRERHVWPTPKTLALYDEWARAKGNLQEETFKREPSRRNPPSRGNLLEETRNSDRGNPLTDNIENIKSIDICANQDLHRCAPSQKRKAEREGQKAKEEWFSRFWAAYPKKRNKARAKQAFFRIKNIEKVFPVMMQALGRQKASADWQKDGGQFIPLPTTWLNGERWEDVEQVDIQPPAQGHDRLTQADVDRMEQEREEQAARDEAEYLSRMKQQEGESGS